MGPTQGLYLLRTPLTHDSVAQAVEDSHSPFRQRDQCDQHVQSATIFGMVLPNLYIRKHLSTNNCTIEVNYHLILPYICFGLSVILSDNLLQ
jgi:hypothetical protein